MLRGEIDAIAATDEGLVTRKADWLEKGLVDLHVIYAIPRETSIRVFTTCPKLTASPKPSGNAKILTMFRNFSLTGSPFILPPAMPKERVETIKEALRKSFKDADFFKEYHKVTGEDPTPLMPEANEKAIRDLPRDPETVELFKKFAGARTAPAAVKVKSKDDHEGLQIHVFISSDAAHGLIYF